MHITSHFKRWPCAHTFLFPDCEPKLALTCHLDLICRQRSCLPGVGRQARGPLHKSALVPIRLCWSPRLSQFLAGEWGAGSRRLRVRAWEGDVVALGQPEWSRLPPGGGGLAMGEPGGGGGGGNGKILCTLPVEIHRALAGRGGVRAVRGSPFPRNGWRGCFFLQSSSSWQPPGCQG